MTTPAPPPEPGDASSRRRVLLALAFTVSVSYGALFYGFSVLLSDTAAGGSFSTTVLSAAFGGAVVTGGLASVVVGRVADRRGVRVVLGVGAVTGGLGLLAFSQATSPVQVLGVWWVLLGPTMAMTFYEPTYVVIDQWFPPSARVRAVATLTLLAGLSGPVSIPLTGALVVELGWRPATALLGVALMLTCGAAAAFVLPSGNGGGRHVPAVAEAAPQDRASPGQGRPAPSMMGDGRFLLFTVAAVFAYGAMEATVVHRIARFEEGGSVLATVAGWAAAAGLLSLPARFALPSLATRFPPTLVLAGVLAILTVAIGLAVDGSPTLVPIHFALFGAVFGAALPLRAVVMGSWYSGHSFGRIMGVQAAAIALGRAGAPAFVGAARDASSSYRMPMGALTAIMASATILVLAVAKQDRAPVMSRAQETA